MVITPSYGDIAHQNQVPGSGRVTVPLFTW